jgi:hypothetical protein
MGTIRRRARLIPAVDQQGMKPIFLAALPPCDAKVRSRNCTRKARYRIFGRHLCKPHAQQLALEKLLRK